MTGTLARLLVAALLLLAGARAYRELVAPDPSALGRLASDELRTIFGASAATAGFEVDLVEGVAIRGLSVDGGPNGEPALAARRVRVRHALLDLVVGLYRPTALEVEGARLWMHETASGLGPDFPFQLRGRGGGGDAPELIVEDAELALRARPGSERLAEGSVLHVRIVRLTTLHGVQGGLTVRGELTTSGLGQDDVVLALGGEADPRNDALDLLLVWDPLLVTPQLTAMLAAETRETLEGSPLTAGRLEVHLTREGGPIGDLEVSVRWLGGLTSDIGELPGLRELSPQDKQRLRDLFGGGTLDLGMERGRLSVRALTTKVGDASVTAQGWVAKDGDSLALTAHLRGLSLTDPALRRALGPQGEEIFAQMEVEGRLDADVTIEKQPGRPLTWGAVARLSELDFLYRGYPTSDGTKTGFPYRLERGSGSLRVGPEGIRVDGIEGRHGERTVLRVLPNSRPSWQGEESGFVRFGQGGASLRLTIEALDMPVDDDLAAAVAGSEFAGLLDVYRIGGLIDRVEVDIVRRPGIDDVVRSEVRVTLDDERFAWSRFPVPLENVRGIVTLTRPPRREAGRESDPSAPFVGVGRRFQVDVRGAIAQPGEPARVTVRADVDAHGATGRLQVTARDVALEGAVDEAVRTSELTGDGLGRIWEFLAPRGRGDVEGDFPLEEDPAPLRLLTRLNGATVTLDAPAGPPSLEVEDIHGVIQAVGDDIRTHGLAGSMLGTPLELEGAWPEGGDGPWSVDLRTSEPLPFTLGFLEAVGRLSGCTLLLPFGLTFEPGGRAALDASVRRERGGTCPELTRLRLSDVDLALRWPDGPAIQVRGDALEVQEGEVTAFGLELGLPGLRAVVHEGSHGPAGLLGRFTLTLEGFELEDEMLGLVPEEDREGVLEWTADRVFSARALEVRLDRDGSLGLTGDLSLVAHPDAPPGGAPRGSLSFDGARLSPPDPAERRAWSGALDLLGFSLSRGVDLFDLRGRLEVERLMLGEDPSAAARLVGIEGRLEDVRFEGLTASAVWNDGLLTVEPITATLAGGDLAARLRVHTRPPEAYEGRLLVRDFDVSRLRDDLAPSGPPFRGTGTLELLFENRTLERRDLKAAGSLHVHDGHLGDLPVIANLFLALESLVPDDTSPSIETLDAHFTVRDDVVRFQRLDLAGPLAKIPGRGRVTLTGMMDVTFTPDVIKGLLLPALMPIPVVGDVLAAVLPEELLYAVRVHGPIDNPRTDVILFPPLSGDHTSTYEPPPDLPEPRRRLPSTFR